MCHWIWIRNLINNNFILFLIESYCDSNDEINLLRYRHFFVKKWILNTTKENLAYNSNTLNGHFSSQVSVYNYAEHLNTFYQDDNHKRLRFWKWALVSKRIQIAVLNTIQVIILIFCSIPRPSLKHHTLYRLLHFLRHLLFI